MKMITFLSRLFKNDFILKGALTLRKKTLSLICLSFKSENL